MRQRDGFGQFLISDEPYTPPESHWSYYYSHGTLAAAGAVAGVSVELPDGVAYRNVGEPGVTYSEEPLLLSRQWVQLRQDGRPLFNSIVSDVPHVWMSEGATMVIECASQTFHPGGEIALNQPVAKYRFESHITVGFLPRFPSNDGYYQGGYWLDSDVAIAPDGLRADVQFSNSVFQTSYPMKAALEHRNMRLSYRQGRIQPGESSFTDARVRMAVYDSGCGTSECPDSPGAQKVPISIAFDSPGHFNEDGSILIDSAVSEPFSPNFNTFTLVPVNHAVWYQPGTIIPDEISTRGGTRIAEHLQAMRKRDAPLHYSMNDPEFYRGSGLFSGLNIMSDELTGKRFNVQISVSDIDLLHSEHSKLYIRPAGYTGVMHAQNAATTFHINPDPECGGEGYAISMTSFGQAYVDNDSSGYDSTIDGTITIEWPSFIRIPFTGMNLDACGQFTTGEVPPDVQRETKQLAYWQADMQVLAIVFQNRVEGGQGCDQNPDDKTLIVISLHSIPHVRDPVMMAIDIRPCGTLRVSKNLMELSTEYDGYPVSLEKLYLSRWDGSPHPKANGFYTIIGDIDVPVFNSPKYQAIIQGENTWLATGDPWKNDAEPDSNGDGFIDRFDSAQFDDVTERLNGYADRYPVQGRTEFANFMPLRYDLHYNPGTRRFRTLEPNRQDLFILDIISAVEYLDRDRTEISFGVDADPMPDLNLSSLAARYGPFSDQIQNLFAETIQRPLDGLSDILSGDITFRVRAQITEDIQARFAVEFSAALRTEFQNHRNDWDNYVQSIDFTNFLQDQIDRFMRQLDLTAYLTSPTQPMVGEITAILTQVESLSQVLKFEDDELGRLTEALLLFAQHGLSAAFDINLNGIMDPIETVRSEVIAFLDNELIPAIEALDDFYGNPLTFLLNDNPRLSEGFFLPANVRQSEDRIKQVLLENLERLGQNAPTQLINIQPGFTAALFVNAFFNTEMVQRVSIKLGQDFRPIKDKLTNQTQRILDAINEQIESVLEEATGYVEGVVADFKNVTGFGGASLK